ncbi:DUF305 domain-containing protein [Telluribacter humicola]
MLTISFIIMYSVMFLNVDRLDHIYLNMNRLYMALLMITPMALLMLAFMGDMYKNRKVNTAIVITSIAVFVAVLALLRNQSSVGDVQYIKSMIPHHSSAILTSQEAALKDPELIKLADEIIKAQEKEIAQMKSMLNRLQK